MFSLNLNNPLEPRPTFSLGTMLPMGGVDDPEAAQQRAERYHFALGETLTPGVQQLMADIQAGREQDYRQLAAQRQDLESTTAYTRTVTDLSNEGAFDQVRQLITQGPPALANPATVLEEDYAKRYLADIYFDDPNGPQAYDQLTPHEQRLYDITYSSINDLIARDEIVRRKYEQYNRQWSNYNFVTQAWDFVETLIPFNDWYVFSTQLNAIPAYSDLRLPGDSLLDQVTYLHRLPLSEFEQKFSEAVDAIANVNMNQAFRFIQAVQSYGRQDQALNNIFTIIDAAGVVGGAATRIGRLGRAASTSINEAADAGRFVPRTNAPSIVPRTGTEEIAYLRQRLKAAQEANSFGEGAPGINAAVGNVQRAAYLESLETQLTRALDTYGPTTARTFSRRLLSFVNPSESLSGNRSFSLARDLVGRSETAMAKLEKASDLLERNMFSIDRLYKEQTDVAFNQATGEGMREFSRYGDNVIRDIRRVDAEDTLTNVNYLDFILGKPDGTLFPDKMQAGKWASSQYKLNKKDYVTEDVAGGAVIRVRRAVDETQDARDGVIPTQHETKSPRLGSLQTADALLPFSQREARKKLVHMQQRSGEFLGTIRKSLRLNKADRNEFSQFLEYLQNTSSFPGLKGKTWSPTAQLDFDTAWRARFGKAPTKAQSQAYWAYVRLHQIEWSLKNMALLRSKERQGVHLIQLTPRGKSKLTVDFEGRIESHFDFSQAKPDEAIMVYNSASQSHEFHRIGNLDSAARKQLLTDIATSKQEVIKVYNRGVLPFKDLGEKKIVDYVVTSDYTRSKLKFEQIPWDPGNKIIYNNPFFVKQLRTGDVGYRKVSWGESNVVPARSKAEAQDFANKLNQARDLYNKANGNYGPLHTFMSNNLPTIDVREFIDSFDNNLLSKTDSFRWVGDGETIFGKYKDVRDELGDHTDLADYTNMGASLESTNKPMWDLNVGDVISPVAAIDRNMTAAIKSGAVADYITKAAEHFVKEFAPVLRTKGKDLNRNPIAALLNPQWLEGGDKNLLRAGKRYQRATRDLLGYQTPFRKTLATIEENVFESIYKHRIMQKHIGDKSIARRVTDVLFHTIPDAPTYARALAFNLTMGFFNPYQIWKQTQTIFVSSAITGSVPRALSSVSGATLMMALNRSSKSAHMIDHFANMATKVGWDADEFKEVYQLADNSGLSIIRGEHTFRDRALDPPIVQSGVHKALHVGTMFFRAGEEMTRLAGLNIAYKEWRKVNPTKAFRRTDQEAVLRRADDLTVNMTHASNAIYNKGLLAFPTQFFSYQLRLMELFWGKRLTVAEKARLLVTQAMLYGLPIGAGIATGILPLHDQIRQSLIESGVELDNVGMQALTEGLYGTLAFLITGHETNAATEFGAGGIDLFVNMVAGDETFRDILLGVAGGKLVDIIDSAYPFIAQFKRAVGLAPREGNINLGWDDISSVLRNITTFTNVERAIYALNTSAYLRRNGDVVLGGDSNQDGILNNRRDRFMEPAEIGLLTAFGVDPAEVNDEFLTTLLMQDWSAHQQKPREQIMQVFEHMLDVLENTSLPLQERQRLSEEMWREVEAWTAMGGFTPDQINGILRDVMGQDGAGTYIQVFRDFSLTTTRANPDTFDTRSTNYMQGLNP